MRLIIMLVLVFLSGCYPKYSGEDIDAMIEFCKKHNGIMFFHPIDKRYKSYVKCNDKSEITIPELMGEE